MNCISGRRQASLTPLPVDERAVERAKITQLEDAVFLEQLAVLPADHGMGNREIGLPAPSDRGG